MFTKLADLTNIQQEEQKTSGQKTCIIPLFFGLPGLGKTTFWEELKQLEKESGIGLEYLAEDGIWSDLMNKQRIKTPEMPDSDIFWAIKDEGTKIYWEIVKNKMDALSKSSEQNIVFFLDKIIYPETL